VVAQQCLFVRAWLRVVATHQQGGGAPVLHLKRDQRTSAAV
jgi:hypothetical protein